MAVTVTSTDYPRKVLYGTARTWATFLWGHPSVLGDVCSLYQLYKIDESFQLCSHEEGRLLRGNVRLLGDVRMRRWTVLLPTDDLLAGAGASLLPAGALL